MCVVSNIGDDYSRRSAWPTWPPQIPFPDRTTPVAPDPNISLIMENQRLRKQLEETRKQVEKMKQDLIEAKQQDIRDGNPDCEMDEKVIVLKKIADIFGIKLTEVFPD